MTPTARSRLPWPLVFQVLGVIAVGSFVVATWRLWVLAFTGLILAAAILPAARVAARYRIPRGLTVLGVKYALLIGSLVAAILGILSALNESAGLAIATTALFWGVNVLEGKVLVPQLVGRATGLHPLAVMIVLLAGAQLGGLIGALVSVPALAALWEIVRTVNRDDAGLVVPPAAADPDRPPSG